MVLKKYSAPETRIYRMVIENNIMSNQNENPVIDEGFPGEEED
jgi:hypothetical protein